MTHRLNVLAQLVAHILQWAILLAFGVVVDWGLHHYVFAAFPLEGAAAIVYKLVEFVVAISLLTVATFFIVEDIILMYRGMRRRLDADRKDGPHAE